MGTNVWGSDSVRGGVFSKGSEEVAGEKGGLSRARKTVPATVLSSGLIRLSVDDINYKMERLNSDLLETMTSIRQSIGISMGAAMMIATSA